MLFETDATVLVSQRDRALFRQKQQQHQVLPTNILHRPISSSVEISSGFAKAHLHAPLLRGDTRNPFPMPVNIPPPPTPSGGSHARQIPAHAQPQTNNSKTDAFGANAPLRLLFDRPQSRQKRPNQALDLFPDEMHQHGGNTNGITHTATGSVYASVAPAPFNTQHLHQPPSQQQRQFMAGQHHHIIMKPSPPRTESGGIGTLQQYQSLHQHHVQPQHPPHKSPSQVVIDARSRQFTEQQAPFHLSLPGDGEKENQAQGHDHRGGDSENEGDDEVAKQFFGRKGSFSKCRLPDKSKEVFDISKKPNSARGSKSAGQRSLGGPKKHPSSARLNRDDITTSGGYRSSLLMSQDDEFSSSNNNDIPIVVEDAWEPLLNGLVSKVLTPKGVVGGGSRGGMRTQSAPKRPHW